MIGSYTASAVDMLDFFERQREWSYETFGPPDHRGPVGPLKHLEKEAKEAYEEADKEKQKVEIIDCLFLVFDAAHRAGMSYSEMSRIAMEKLQANKLRQWPDWKKVNPNSAVEHVRGEGE